MSDTQGGTARLTRDDAVKIIYSHGPVQRFTQDSPVLADVWIGYAQEPHAQQDLLLTPYQAALATNDPKARRSSEAALTPGRLARELGDRLQKQRRTQGWKQWPRTGADRSPRIAYNQSTVAVRLWFDELVHVVLPMSRWWDIRIRRDRGATVFDQLATAAGRRRAVAWLSGSAQGPDVPAPDVLWALQVIGTIAAAGEPIERNRVLWPPPPVERKKDREEYFALVIRALAALVRGLKDPGGDPLVYLVSCNRPAKSTIWRSREAMKADAAARLFNVKCDTLAWAVIDSGIDATHPAFRRREDASEAAPLSEPGPLFPKAFDKDGNHTRVLGTYDFTVIRDLLSGDDTARKRLPAAVRRRLDAHPEEKKRLRESLNGGREIDWELIKRLIEVPHPEYEAPVNEHGTHVAGILAADWRVSDGTPPGNARRAKKRAVEGVKEGLPPQDVIGVCPDINLFDLRVLDRDGTGSEFNVMAALQFVRYLNLNNDVMVVHGVNLSLSLAHDVLNYACGRTPICDECERLVGGGVVVVAAAGNEGYQTLPLPTGAVPVSFFQSISITDPGNAESVITVGATHRDSPHTYGVSYFSSRGPTGDGRCKPDIVAPGEKIEAPIPGGDLKRLDGTSMAAPHVSGAAALLMARHRELLGQPQRIKEILCRTATDLGREKYFQGSGMIDALRALQSV